MKEWGIFYWMNDDGVTLHLSSEWGILYLVSKSFMYWQNDGSFIDCDFVSEWGIFYWMNNQKTFN